MSSTVDITEMSTYADIMIVRTARDLGAAVRDARLQRGWTQAELADRIDVSKDHGRIGCGIELTAVSPVNL